MPVMIVLSWDNFTLEQYDELNQAVDTVGNPPEGLIVHAAGSDGAGIRVTDVWRSTDDFNRFIAQRLGPALQSQGMDAEPQAEIIEVHHLEIPDRA